MHNRIHLAAPHLSGNEMRYIKEAFKSNWIAPLGKNIDLFEKETADYLGLQHAAALISGTAAIHLGLKWLGVAEGDYVFCSTLTFSGSCNSIIYERGIPVFIDSERKSWNMCSESLKKAFAYAERINKLPKAVIIVNIYGQSADYDKLIPVCAKYNTPIIEDAAESLGAIYKKQKSGSFGNLSVLSFNGNKIITTSGGGMILSNEKKAIEKAKFWASQSRDNFPFYHHTELGYNYRLSNISAGIGRGQLKALDERVEQKKDIYFRYKNAFSDIEDIEMMPIPSWSRPNYWLSVLTLKENSKIKPSDIIEKLAENNIEGRHVWKPMHMQPIFGNYPFFKKAGKSVAEDLFERGLCLPSSTRMKSVEQDFVIDIIKGMF